MGNFGNIISGVGEAAGTIGSIYGIGQAMFGKDANQESFEYSKRLIELQNRYNQMAMQSQFELGKQMYEYTGYESKVRQMKAAGLNPALLYGMGGTGGGTVGGGAALGVSGASAPNTTGAQANKMAVAGMGLQLAKMQSEIAVNQSIAKANEAAATKTTTAEIPKLQTEIKSIEQGIDLMYQQTQNQAVLRAGYVLDNDMKRMQNSITEATTVDQINTIKSKAAEVANSAKLLFEEYRKGKVQADVAEKTINETIQQIRLNVSETMSKILLNNANRKLSETEAKATTERVIQGYEALVQSGQKMQIDLLQIEASLDIVDKNNINAMDRVKANGWFGIAEVGLGAILGYGQKMLGSGGGAAVKGFAP